MSIKVPASDLLKSSLQTLIDRGTKRDTPDGERSMARTVAIFNAWTGSGMSEEDGWKFMVALKMARMTRKFNIDNYVDAQSYFALLGEHSSTLNLTEL